MRGIVGEGRERKASKSIFVENFWVARKAGKCDGGLCTEESEESVSSRKRPPHQSGPNTPPLTPAISTRGSPGSPQDVHKTPIEEHGKLQVVGSEAHRRELKSLYNHIGKGLAIDVSWEARRTVV